uniref:SET domain-containing protein n=1 Tax=Spongospora subterranea TaxID=70186 RepID=A0A0H5R6H0_9EUKA|eukprot:CRZ09357.1 hypothetical protein [Spongospora subterranea]
MHTEVAPFPSHQQMKSDKPVLHTFKYNQSGKFCAALAPVKQGTVVFEEVGEMKSKPDKYTLQLDDDQHMLCSGPLIFCNHSCKPNCKAVVAYGLVSMVAIRPIETDEPITFDYNTTEYDMASPFDCICGAENCAHRIAGFKNLSPQHKESIDRKLMSPFILEKAKSSSSK